MQIDFGWRAVWGLLVLINAGAWLNLAGLVSASLLVTIVMVGLLALFWIPSRRAGLPAPSRRPAVESVWPAVAVWTIVCILVGVRYAASAFGNLTCGAGSSFNCHDDFHAYFVFPTKLLQMGSIGHDPFNHRLLTALGGQTFLQALTLAVLPHEALNLLDGGVGLILVCATLAGYSRRIGSGWICAGLSVLAFLGMAIPVTNIQAACSLRWPCSSISSDCSISTAQFRTDGSSSV